MMCRDEIANRILIVELENLELPDSCVSVVCVVFQFYLWLSEFRLNCKALPCRKTNYK
jgi:hypothetical protein